MKKYFLLSIAFLIAITTFATDIPKAIQDAFSKKFPTAKSVKWDKENANEYEASFLLNGIKNSANYTVQGLLLETESEIKVSELPSAITLHIQKKYHDWKIVGAAKIEHVKNGIQFEADLQKGKSKKEVLYTETGVFIK